MLGVLLKHQLRWWWNASFRRRRTGWFVVPLIVVVTGLFVLGAMSFFRLAGRADPSIPESLLPALFPATAFLFVLSSTTVWLQRLYLNDDLRLLVAAPIPPRDLYLFKLVGTSLASLLLVGMLKAAILTGYGLAVRARALFYPAALVSVVGQLLIASVLGMAFVLVLARFVPRRRLKAVVAVLGPVQGLAFFALSQFMAGGDRGRAAQLEYYRGLGRSARRVGARFAWSPTTWGADALVAVQHGRWAAASLRLAAVVAMALALVALGGVLFRRVFLEGFSRAVEVTPVRVRAARAPGPARIGWLPQDVRALVLKDWRSMRRDVSWLSGLVMPTAIALFTVVRAVNDRGSERMASLGFTVPLVLFMMCMPALQVFSTERDAYVLLRVSPVSSRTVVAGKLFAMLPAPVLVTWTVLVILGVFLRLPPALFPIAFPSCAVLIAGVLLLHLTVATLSARSALESPRSGRPVQVLWVFVLLVVDAVFSAPLGALTLWVAARVTGDLPASLASPLVPAALVVVAGAFFAGALGALGVAIRRLDRLEVR